MSYELRISKPALKFLEKHPMEKKKFLEIFKEMSTNYEDAVNKYDIKQMQGISTETYRGLASISDKTHSKKPKSIKSI